MLIGAIQFTQSNSPNSLNIQDLKTKLSKEKDSDRLDEVWKIHEKEKLIFEREYFFDITSFYGRNNRKYTQQ